MADLLTFENLGNLLMLCFLQAVLGFDNLLYISIESQRAPVAQQRSVRYWGIIIAVALRVVLLFLMIPQISCGQAPSWSMLKQTIRATYPDVRQVSTDSLASWQAGATPWCQRARVRSRTSMDARSNADRT